MGRYTTFIVLLLWLSGCTNKQSSKQIDRQIPFKAIGIAPGKDSIRPPKVVMLDTCPATLLISIPTKSSIPGPESYKGKQGIDVKSSALIPAVYSVSMTTYGAEQGLYSAINVIKKDKAGNFWFGAGGGGVIRYDGKAATSFTTAQGLASNNIRSIAEDKNGNFWFGSFGGGASFYDGKSFTTITQAQGLSNNNIRSIIIDSSGNIWFGTWGGGISIYNGKSFTILTMKNGLPSNNVMCMMQSRDGSIWCGTDSGVSHCTLSSSPRGQKSFANYTTAKGLASSSILSIAEDRKGNIWFGTDGGGVSCFSHNYSGGPAKLFKTYTTAQGLPNNTVNSIFEDKEGELWFCTEGGGVCSYDPSALRSTGSTAKQDSVQGTFTNYTTDQGLCMNFVTCVEEDEAGHLWFGTRGGGVSRFDGVSLKLNIRPQGLPKTTIMSVNGDKAGNIWFGSDGGWVFCYDGKYFVNYATQNALGGGAVISILNDKEGHLWLGTNGKGLYRCNERPKDGHPAQFTSYGSAQGLANNTIWSLTEDTAGNIWMATRGGVVCFNGKSFVTYTTAQGLGNNTVWSTFSDKSGNMWFGTFGGGVSRFVAHPDDGGAARFVSYKREQGLASNNVKSISQDKSGNLWFGTGGGGVSRFDGNSFVNYTTLQGLTNNIVVAISEDKSGAIWFGTNEGFTVLKGYRKIAPDGLQGKGDGDSSQLLPPDNNRSNNDIAENYVPVFEKYNFKNGYPVKDVNTGAMYIDNSGITWAGTGDKLVSFDYSKLNKNYVVPHVFINAVKIGGESICWYELKNRRSNKLQQDARFFTDSLAMINEELNTLGDLSTPLKRDEMYEQYRGVRFDSIAPFYPLPLNLVLPYNNNSITFDFAAVELTRPYLVKYQYMLEGYDKDWNPVTKISNATFGNMHEGTYTFKLRAQSPDGVWSEPVTYSFKVLPPFYRTWWAKIIYCLALAYFIYLIVHFRTRILKKENERLERVVAERTAQIEQEKAAVEIQANDLKKLNLFKDKTFSILSHDLRGPINTSTSVVNLLDDGDISTEEFKSMKEGMVKQLNSTTVLLDNLLKWAKASMEGNIEPNLQTVNIYDIVHRNLSLFEDSLKTKNISLSSNVPQDVTAFCDPEHTDIVVRNLLMNAIKFTRENGAIEVSVKTEHGKVLLTVADNGVGMTSEQLDKLFKPITNNTTYGTSGEKGTGLGLLLSYDFIKANKGDIQVSSELGKGTTFTVVLPVG